MPTSLPPSPAPICEHLEFIVNYSQAFPFRVPSLSPCAQGDLAAGLHCSLRGSALFSQLRRIADAKGETALHRAVFLGHSHLLGCG